MAHLWRDHGSRKEIEAGRLRGTLPLLEHTITSRIEPYIDVYVGPSKVQHITIAIELHTKLSGITLRIKEGMLVSIECGNCSWSGSISVQGATLIDRKLSTIEFPGRYTLKSKVNLVA